MVNLDVQPIDNELDYYGNSVTIRAVTKSLTASKWGDVSETTSDTTGINCIVNIFSEADAYVREGIFKAGDARFFFKASNSSIIVNGNRILYSDHWYEIYDTHQTKLGDTIYCIEALTHKV